MTSHSDFFAIVFYFGCVALAFVLLAVVWDVIENERERRLRWEKREWEKRMGARP